MRIRQTLTSIALAAPLAGCPIVSDCPERADRTLLLGENPEADPDLGPLLEACKSQQDCDPLCDFLYERERGIPTEPGTLEGCALTVDGESSQYMVTFSTAVYCVGRRPAGYLEQREQGQAGAVASYLCVQAELEAASVRAFGDLLDDLIALRAPASLRRAMVSAAADEVRHALTCRRLARRHGASPETRRIAKAARRSRYEVAADNLIEGCIRETYGAVVAGYQARAAGDPEVRAAMATIACDEAKHAALSWRLHHWLWPQLSADEQRALLAAAAVARSELGAGGGTDDADLRRIVGLPDAAATHHMLGALDEAVWSAIS